MTWEFGAAIAKLLKAIDTSMAEEGRKITEIDLKVEATGEKMSKKYMVTPRMSAKALRLMASCRSDGLADSSQIQRR